MVGEMKGGGSFMKIVGGWYEKYLPPTISAVEKEEEEKGRVR